jgi:predicted TIM-barrel fold metal-dependent hydrolase
MKGSERMRIIDAATCIGTRPEDERVLDVAALLQEMDRAGVAEALCTHFCALRYHARTGNAALEELCRKEPRLHPVAIINPAPYRGVAEEIARCAQEGFAGFRFVPHAQGWSLESEPFHAALEAVATTGLPSAVELSASGDATRLARIVEGLGVPVVLANITYSTLGEAVIVMKRHTTLYLEAHRLVTPGVVELLVAELGVERLLFASGAPFWEIVPTLSMIREADLSEDAKCAILGENARQLFRLDQGGQA